MHTILNLVRAIATSHYIAIAAICSLVGRDYLLFIGLSSASSIGNSTDTRY